MINCGSHYDKLWRAVLALVCLSFGRVQSIKGLQFPGKGHSHIGIGLQAQGIRAVSPLGMAQADTTLLTLWGCKTARAKAPSTLKTPAQGK